MLNYGFPEDSNFNLLMLLFQSFTSYNPFPDAIAESLP
jgi:hypothetical protein